MAGLLSMGNPTWKLQFFQKYVSLRFLDVHKHDLYVVTVDVSNRPKNCSKQKWEQNIFAIRRNQSSKQEKHLRFRPFYREFIPEPFGHHPSQTREEIRAIQEFWFLNIDEIRFAIIIPGRDAP